MAIRPRIAVAASGGRDSTALLHLTARQAQGGALQVWALHVHHGLMPQADAWLKQLQAQCARWARGGLPVHFKAHRLTGQTVRLEVHRQAATRPTGTLCLQLFQPRICLRHQAMVHVQGPHLQSATLSLARREVQQGGRVTPAACGHRDAGPNGHQASLVSLKRP